MQISGEGSPQDDGGGGALPVRAVDRLPPREELGAETGLRAAERAGPVLTFRTWNRPNLLHGAPSPAHSSCARVIRPTHIHFKLVPPLEWGEERARGGAGQGGESLV